MGTCCTYYKASCQKSLQEQQIMDQILERVEVEPYPMDIQEKVQLEQNEPSVNPEAKLLLDQIITEVDSLLEQQGIKKNAGTLQFSQSSLQGSNPESQHTNPNQFYFQKDKNMININTNSSKENDETKRTPNFQGTDKALNNSAEMQEIYQGLKAENIISNKPLEILIEEKLKFNLTNNNQKNSVLEISKSPPNRNIQQQKLSRSITQRFEHKAGDFDNNMLDGVDGSSSEESQEKLEKARKKKKTFDDKFKRCNTKQFDYEQNNNKEYDSQEGTYKTQKSILKKRDKSLNSHLKYQKKKSVKINEAENETHRIPKITNFY